MPYKHKTESITSASTSTNSNYEVDEIHVTTLTTSPTGRLVRPNWWWKYRYVLPVFYKLHSTKTLHRQLIREVAAEFTGTMFLIIFGVGVVHQVTLSSNTTVSSEPKGVGYLLFLRIRDRF